MQELSIHLWSAKLLVIEMTSQLSSRRVRAEIAEMVLQIRIYIFHIVVLILELFLFLQLVLIDDLVGERNVIHAFLCDGLGVVESHLVCLIAEGACSIVISTDFFAIHPVIGIVV